MPSFDSSSTGVTCKGSNVWRTGACGIGFSSRTKRYMPAMHSIHCQSVLERSVLFNVCRLASKLITVSQFLDWSSVNIGNDRRLVDLTVTFSSLFTNCRDVRGRASGASDRVLADETGVDLRVNNTIMPTSTVNEDVMYCYYAYRYRNIVVRLLNNGISNLLKTPNYAMPQAVSLSWV